MHIVFKKVPLKTRRGSTLVIEARRSFRLGESVRNELVKYLGSIRENSLTLPVARRAFWNSVDTRLDALNLPEFERVKLVNRIATRVPRA